MSSIFGVFELILEWDRELPKHLRPRRMVPTKLIQNNPRNPVRETHNFCILKSCESSLATNSRLTSSYNLSYKSYHLCCITTSVDGVHWCFCARQEFAFSCSTLFWTICFCKSFRHPLLELQQKLSALYLFNQLIGCWLLLSLNSRTAKTNQLSKKKPWSGCHTNCLWALPKNPDQSAKFLWILV